MSNHFGYEANEKVCSCGRHFGCGEITPEIRAARAARMRDKMPSLMREEMKAFLANFEIYHGRVKYTMQVIGIKTGYCSKSEKGQDLLGPVYTPEKQPQTSSLFA